MPSTIVQRGGQRDCLTGVTAAQRASLLVLGAVEHRDTVNPTVVSARSP
jgi:hypothetical protein